MILIIMNTLKDICNNNPKNIVQQEIYDAFNKFIFSSDIRILGKLLHRYFFYQKIKELPGDIIEVGVFKGSGVATWSKILEIFEPNSNRKVIGFDLFDKDNKVIANFEHGDLLNIVYNRTSSSELTLEKVEENLSKMDIKDSKYILVKGDVCETTKEFIKKNPGCRIALLYMDLDLAEPTYHTLKNLWDKILPSGIVVFDEYEYHKFDESNGVDKFLKEFNIEYNVKSTHFIGPTAYLEK